MPQVPKFANENEVLMKRAFELGQRVGFYNHFEGLGWVGETWQNILREAEMSDISHVVREMYARGKKNGAEKRAVTNHRTLNALHGHGKLSRAWIGKEDARDAENAATRTSGDGEGWIPHEVRGSGPAEKPGQVCHGCGVRQEAVWAYCPFCGSASWRDDGLSVIRI